LRLASGQGQLPGSAFICRTGSSDGSAVAVGIFFSFFSFSETLKAHNITTELEAQLATANLGIPTDDIMMLTSRDCL